MENVRFSSELEEGAMDWSAGAEESALDKGEKRSGVREENGRGVIEARTKRDE